MFHLILYFRRNDAEGGWFERGSSWGCSQSYTTIKKLEYVRKTKANRISVHSLFGAGTSKWNRDEKRCCWQDPLFFGYRSRCCSRKSKNKNLKYAPTRINYLTYSSLFIFSWLCSCSLFHSHSPISLCPLRCSKGLCVCVCMYIFRCVLQ